MTTILNLPLTKEELNETIDALQVTINALKWLIAQPTTPESERSILGVKLLYVEGLLKRLVALVDIGQPVNKSIL